MYLVLKNIRIIFFNRSLAILSDLHMAGDEKVAEVTVDALHDAYNRC